MEPERRANEFKLNHGVQNLNENPTFITVIMPAHNAARTLKSAICSTLLALPKNAELLIFLDGCSDNSEQVAKAFSDPRVKVHKSEKNVGVARALNEMLEVAQGFYTARMDADDICLPGRFRTQARELARSGSDFVFSNAILFGQSVSPFGLMPQPPFRLDEHEAHLALIFGNPFVHPTMFAKTSSIKTMGGYRSLPAEDYDLWLRASANGMEIRKLRSFGILYRVHKAQLTQQKAWQQRNSDCIEIEEGKKALASRMLGIPVPTSLDFATLRNEVVTAVVDGTFQPTPSLTKLIGFKATLRAMFRKWR